jgi:hypothetical protein
LPPEIIRDIETRGCMGTDYEVQEGTVIARFSQCIAGCGSKLFECYRIRLNHSGRIIERVREAALRAPDGVLEWRW